MNLFRRAAGRCSSSLAQSLWEGNPVLQGVPDSGKSITARSRRLLAHRLGRRAVSMCYPTIISGEATGDVVRLLDRRSAKAGRGEATGN